MLNHLIGSHLNGQKILEETGLIFVWSVQSSQGNTFPFSFNVTDNESAICVRI